jgi:hypothetical protein
MFNVFTRLSSFVRNLRTIVSDGLSFLAGVWRRHKALAAENLFLRKQLALFREREKKPMPTTPADRFVFSKLARWFDWRNHSEEILDDTVQAEESLSLTGRLEATHLPFPLSGRLMRGFDSNCWRTAPHCESRCRRRLSLRVASRCSFVPSVFDNIK